MLIIIEGPDRTGKDTLIKNINKYFDKTFLNVHSFGFGLPPEEEKVKARKVYFDTMRTFLGIYGAHIIWNRSYLGEYVYGKIIRNYDFNIEEFENDFKYTDLFRTAKLIVLVDDPKNLVKREDGNSLSNGDLLTTKIQEVQRFKDVFDKTQICDKILIDIRDKTTDDVFSAVKEFLMK